MCRGRGLKSCITCAGVGARGLPEMQAQLYKLEQEAATKRAAGIPLAKPRRPAGPQLGKANAGVAERAERDRLQAPVGTAGECMSKVQCCLKFQTAPTRWSTCRQLQTEANRLAESEAALQRKAALYDRLARGEGTEAEEVRAVCANMLQGRASSAAMRLVTCAVDLCTFTAPSLRPPDGAGDVPC